MKLRCWPGCLAYVRNVNPCTLTVHNRFYGPYSFVAVKPGTIVKCVKLVNGDYWELETPLIVKHETNWAEKILCRVTSIKDQCLTPIKDFPPDQMIDTEIDKELNKDKEHETN